MQTPRMFSTVRTAAPALTDAGVGVGVAVLVLAANAAGVGPGGSSALVHSTPWRSGWSGLWPVPWRCAAATRSRCWWSSTRSLFGLGCRPVSRAV